MKNITDLLLGKVLVDSFVYHINNDYAKRHITINGREYDKYGVLQAVTFYGLLFKVPDGDNILFVGMSRQNPEDIFNNKKIGIKVARMSAMEDPISITKVPNLFGEDSFYRMCDDYYITLADDLNFVKTKQELSVAQD